MPAVAWFCAGAVVAAGVAAAFGAAGVVAAVATELAGHFGPKSAAMPSRVTKPNLSSGAGADSLLALCWGAFAASYGTSAATGACLGTSAMPCGTSVATGRACLGTSAMPCGTSVATGMACLGTSACRGTSGATGACCGACLGTSGQLGHRATLAWGLLPVGELLWQLGQAAGHAWQLLPAGELLQQLELAWGLLRLHWLLLPLLLWLHCICQGLQPVLPNQPLLVFATSLQSRLTSRGFGCWGCLA